MTALGDRTLVWREVAPRLEDAFIHLLRQHTSSS
jgi:hypothetical protein